ncbi:MAG TPA: tetratricopeptide repeat protein [Bacteroidales bacterium]|nr:tetratricopeptide repeat protein [Bacteroidales bacterium]
MKPGKISVFCISVVCMLLFSVAEGKAQQEIPDNIKDYITRGIAAFENAKVPADIDKALLEFNQAEKIAPDFPDIHYYLGKTYSLLQGNAGRAVKELKRYLELYPDAPEKEELTAEIARLEKVIASKRLSTLNGVELMQLSDGIYIRRLLGPNVGGRITSRNQSFSLMPGDKLVTVNKTDISDLTFDQVLRLFDRDSTARFVPAEVIRGGVAHNVVLERSTILKSDDVRVLGEEDLSTIIEESAVPVITMFCNSVNPDCKKYMFYLSRLAYQFRGKIQIMMAYVDDNVSISTEFNIDTIPTILFYRDKKLIGKITGFQPELLTEKANNIETTDPFGL